MPAILKRMPIRFDLHPDLQILFLAVHNIGDDVDADVQLSRSRLRMAHCREMLADRDERSCRKTPFPGRSLRATRYPGVAR